MAKIQSKLGTRLRSFLSLIVACVLILGSAWIGVWRTSRPGVAPGSEPVAVWFSGDGQTKAVIDDPDEEIDEGATPPMEGPLTPVSGDRRPTVIVGEDSETPIRELLRPLEQATAARRRWRARELGALEELARRAAAERPPHEASVALEQVLAGFLRVSDPRLPPELAEAVQRVSAAYGSEFERVRGASLLNDRMRIHLETEQLLGQLARVSETGVQAPLRDIRRLTQQLKALPDVDKTQPRVSKAIDQFEDALLARATALGVGLDFEAAQRELEFVAEIRPTSSKLARARLDYNAQRAQAQADLLRRFDEAIVGRDPAAAREVLTIIERIFGAGAQNRGLSERIVNLELYGGFSPGESFADRLSRGGSGPRLVVIPVGSFTMGSAENEAGRRAAEGPTRSVRFRTGFAIAQGEISVGEFSAFVEASGYRTEAEREGWSSIYDLRSGRVTRRNGTSWRNDFSGRAAKSTFPALHLSWNDAQAYLTWLSEQTGQRYRLPTEAEFEYALRAGTTTRYWWGDGSPTQLVENLTGENDQSSTQRRWNRAFAGYTDRFWGPAPVKSFKPNGFGLFDMAGNVSEWVEDCWHDTYARAPRTPRAWVNPGCELRVIRGGSWGSAPDDVRSAHRQSAKPDGRGPRTGFRVVRELGVPPAAAEGD